MDPNKVVLGLSGGVDSAVAAARLRQQGMEVYGVWLDAGVQSPEAARKAAEELEIPLEIVDIREELEHHVCTPFAAGYLAGETPLPCAVCNPTVKFPALLRVAGRIGAKWVATGHYARTSLGENGRICLLRGRSANDQSYLLARLTQEILQRVLFPLGDTEKNNTRQQAAQNHLTAADSPDSMEICFVPDDDYAGWLDRRGPTPPPGDFMDVQGHVLGKHKGIHHYTIGQRRGLGISADARLFVTQIDREHNTVILSKGEDLYKSTVWCDRPNWISIPAPTQPLEAEVRFRHSRTSLPARVIPEGSGVIVEPLTPARAPTPGQLAVFYEDDMVLGSAWIRDSR